jgi:HK97 family phage major capsid protein
VNDFVKSYGGGVKAVGDYTLQGRGIVYGGQDLTGDRFTKATDLGDTRSFVGTPVYYDHGLSSIRGQIGTVKAWTPVGDGIDVQIELDKRLDYIDDVMALVKSGALGLSTGALSHLVVRQAGELKRWVVGEISLTPTPAEPRTLTEVKATQDNATRTAVATLSPSDTTLINQLKGITVENINQIVQDAVVAALKNVAGEPVNGGVMTAPATKTVTTRGFSNEPMEALKYYLKTGDRIAAKTTLAEGSSNTGGYLVPVDLYDQIIARRDEQSLLGAFNFRRIVTKEKQIVIPGQSTKGSFAIVSESGAANFSEPNFANSKTVTLYKYSLAMKITSELLNDEQSNLQSFLSTEIARAYAQAVNNFIINGSGSSEPYGILARASNSTTAASATAVTFAEVSGLEYTVTGAYMTGGNDVGWIMKNSTLGKIRALTGNYPQFQPLSTNAIAGKTGNLRELDGYPVFTSEYTPAMTTGLKSIIFGNMNYYNFVENGQLEIKRNDSLYMATDEIGYFCYFRAGGDVNQGEAFSYIVQA